VDDEDAAPPLALAGSEVDRGQRGRIRVQLDRWETARNGRGRHGPAAGADSSVRKELLQMVLRPVGPEHRQPVEERELPEGRIDRNRRRDGWLAIRPG
jgi:hypothetical protein